MRGAVLFGAALFASLPLLRAAAIDDCVNDMNWNHEGIPRGLPDNSGWKYKGRILFPGSNGSGYNQIVHWGTVYEPDYGNTAANTRVHLRNNVLYVRWGSTWYLQQQFNRVDGGHYREDFGNNNQNWRPGDRRDEGDGSSVRAGSRSDASKGGGLGRNYHFYAFTRKSINTGHNGVCAWTDFRLVKHNATGVDDRGSARYLVNVGADFYNNNVYKGDVAIGRLKYGQTGWRRVYMHNLTESAMRANPPPFN
jgi:hypothetical protein